MLHQLVDMPWQRHEIKMKTLRLQLIFSLLDALRAQRMLTRPGSEGTLAQNQHV